MKSLYKECTRWLFLNLAGLYKHMCNETKKIVFIIIPEGNRGKWAALLAPAPGNEVSHDGNWTLFLGVLPEDRPPVEAVPPTVA